MCKKKFRDNGLACEHDHLPIKGFEWFGRVECFEVYVRSKV